MRVLVTGVNGQLGYDVVLELERRGHAVIATDANQMDITKMEQVRSVITNAKVDGVIHCAAYTAVDAAEENQELCSKVNTEGTRNIATMCNELDIKMVYISTDYVFNGQGTEHWHPDESQIAPLNIYGQTKYEGEQAVQELVKKFYIVRIAWVFGINGNNFIKTMLRLGKERGAVSVVSDQFGSPTYTYDLAPLLVDMMETENYGVYHATNEGICSWYDFACEIFNQAGMDTVTVTPVDSSTFPVKAKRPNNSRMSKDKLEENGYQRLPVWQDAVGRYLQEIML
ncbi:MAG: dTDP-4-dehydrorhamnose reductase [bacterium]|nr:dTDP-4-dehydrorhamnose reductase [bacterium]